MAKQTKTTLKTLIGRKKAIDLNLGSLTQEKKDALFQFRDEYIDFANNMMDFSFKKEFLKENTSKKHIQQHYTLPFQKQYNRNINKAYLEKARKSVEASLYEQYQRMTKGLLESIHNIDQKAFHKTSILKKFKRENKVVPTYKYIKVLLQDQVSLELNKNKDFLNDIKETFKKVKKESRLNWIRSILIDGETKGLNSLQIAILHSAYESIQERFKQPRFGINDHFSITIDLDYRLFEKNKYKQHIVEMDKHYNWLVDKTNAHYCLFLELTNPIQPNISEEDKKSDDKFINKKIKEIKSNHLKRIRIPIALNQALFERAIRDSKEIDTSVQSLSLVIHHNKIALKSVISREDITHDLESQYKALKEAKHFIGRDFGYSDTISLRVIENDFNLSYEEFERRMNLNKEETKALYQTHVHTPNIVDEFQANGKNFMKSLKQTSIKIDTLKSEIDHIYNKIDDLLFNIKHHLNLQENEWLERDQRTNNLFVNKLIDKFFKLYDAVVLKKAKVRTHYSTIAGKKRSWFGFLINIEKRLCKKYNAAMIVEDLTTMAVEKEKPDYKGRSFNKMINRDVGPNVSKGQYMRLAQAQLLWHGMTEIRIPAFYSSKTCTEHALVEDKLHSMRKNKVFFCPECNKKEDADLHASSTISSFLCLREFNFR